MTGPTLCSTKTFSVTVNDYASLTRKPFFIMNLCEVIMHRFNVCLHQQFICFFFLQYVIIMSIIV